MVSCVAVTIIAFVFLPISLATSIFGMNVQQINNTGKEIWVFIVTAVLLTCLAIGTWALSTLFLEGRKRWLSRDRDDHDVLKKLQIVIDLVLTGRTWWMIQTGVLYGLLINEQYTRQSKLLVIDYTMPYYLDT